MQTEEVQRAIEELRAARTDAGIAHEIEDNIRRRVLGAIAAGAPNAAALAEAALATEAVEFPRGPS